MGNKVNIIIWFLACLLLAGCASHAYYTKIGKNRYQIESYDSSYSDVPLVGLALIPVDIASDNAEDKLDQKAREVCPNGYKVITRQKSEKTGKIDATIECD